MDRTCRTHIVEFENYDNKDGSLTHIKFYINEWEWIDGELDTYEVFDYVTSTVAELDGQEVILSEEINKSLFDELKEDAIIKCINNLDRYVYEDLGGGFE